MASRLAAWMFQMHQRIDEATTEEEASEFERDVLQTRYITGHERGSDQSWRDACEEVRRQALELPEMKGAA